MAKKYKKPEIDDRYIKVIEWILQRYHVGINNRISRPGLLRKVRAYIPECSDRQMRDAIAKTAAISSSGIGGYWWPANKKEANDFIDELSSRQVSIAIRKKAIEDYVKRQNEMFKVHQPELIKR